MHRFPIALLALLFVLSGCTKNKTDDADDTTPAEETQPTDAADAADDDADAQDEEDAAPAVEVERETQRWYVGDEKVACGSSEEESCFRIRRAGNPEWETITGDIEGFEWVEGTRFILEVDVLTPVADAPEEDTEQAEGAADENADAANDEDAADAAAQKAADVRYEMKRQISPLPSGEEEETCTSQADCGEGEMCTGPAGCDIPWTCEPMRPCTKDLRQYCSCEGETIQGSGSCPPAPYKHVGPCKDAE